MQRKKPVQVLRGSIRVICWSVAHCSICIEEARVRKSAVTLWSDLQYRDTSRNVLSRSHLRNVLVSCKPAPRFARPFWYRMLEEELSVTPHITRSLLSRFHVAVRKTSVRNSSSLIWPASLVGGRKGEMNQAGSSTKNSLRAQLTPPMRLRVAPPENQMRVLRGEGAVNSFATPTREEKVPADKVSQ